MRSWMQGAMALAIVVAVPAIAGAKTCEDDAAVAAARAAADAACGCETSSSHGQYVRCANEVAKQRVATGALPRECQSEVTQCAARSTCGRNDDSVTCCRVEGDGDVSCEIQASAAECEALPGVTCVGSATSCCDACEGSPGGSFVCGGSTTTTTTAAPTTSTAAPTTTTAAPTTTTAAPTTTTAAPTTSTSTTEAPTTSTAAPTTTTEEPTTSSTSSTTTTTLIGSPNGAFVDEA